MLLHPTLSRHDHVDASKPSIHARRLHDLRLYSSSWADRGSRCRRDLDAPGPCRSRLAILAAIIPTSTAYIPAALLLQVPLLVHRRAGRRRRRRRLERDVDLKVRRAPRLPLGEHAAGLAPGRKHRAAGLECERELRREEGDERRDAVLGHDQHLGQAAQQRRIALGRLGDQELLSEARVHADGWRLRCPAAEVGGGAVA